MPLQTVLNVYPTKLQPGQQVTTSPYNRVQLNPSNDLLWDQTAEAEYGTVVGYDKATAKWVKLASDTFSGQLGVVIYDSRIIDKKGYRKGDLLSLETCGDRVVKTTQVAIDAYDPVFVFINGGNAGLFTNAANAAAGNKTVRVKGYFMKSKIAADNSAHVCFDLMSPLAIS